MPPEDQFRAVSALNASPGTITRAAEGSVSDQLGAIDVAALANSMSGSLPNESTRSNRSSKIEDKANVFLFVFLTFLFISKILSCWFNFYSNAIINSFKIYIARNIK